MAKFKEGELVLYKDGDEYKIGEITSIVKEEGRHYWNDEEIYHFEYDSDIDAVVMKNMGQNIIGHVYSDRKSVFFENMIDEEIMDILDTCEEYRYIPTRFFYRVWYHAENSTVLTDERLLYKISNAHAFTPVKKSSE